MIARFIKADSVKAAGLYLFMGLALVGMIKYLTACIKTVGLCFLEGGLYIG